MKITDAVWNRTVERLEILRKQNEIHESAARAIMLSPKSPITNPLGYITEVAIVAISDVIGAGDWLSYFVWECDYGLNPRALSVSLGGCESREIRGYDDIRWVIENDN